MAQQLRQLPSLPLHEHAEVLAELVRAGAASSADDSGGAVLVLHGAILALLDRLWVEAVTATFSPVFADPHSLLRAVATDMVLPPLDSPSVAGTDGAGGVFCEGPAAGAAPTTAGHYDAARLLALVDAASALADAAGTPLSAAALNRLILLRGLGSLEGAWAALDATAARGVAPSATSLWLLLLACLRHRQPAAALPVVMAAWARGLALPDPLLRALAERCARDDALPPPVTPELLWTSHRTLVDVPSDSLAIADSWALPEPVAALLSDLQRRSESTLALSILISHLIGLQLEEVHRSVVEIRDHRRRLQRERRSEAGRGGGWSRPRRHPPASFSVKGDVTGEEKSADEADQSLLSVAVTATELAVDTDPLPSRVDAAHSDVPAGDSSASAELDEAGPEAQSTGAPPAGGRAVLLVTASDALDEDDSDAEEVIPDSESSADSESSSGEDDTFGGDDDAEDADGDDADDAGGRALDADADGDYVEPQLEAGVEVDVETGQQVAVLVSPADRNAVVARLGELDPSTDFSQAVAALAERRRHREARAAERQRGRSKIRAALLQRQARVQRRRQRSSVWEPPREPRRSSEDDSGEGERRRRDDDLEEPAEDEVEEKAVYEHLGAQKREAGARQMGGAAPTAAAAAPPDRGPGRGGAAGGPDQAPGPASRRLGEPFGAAGVEVRSASADAVPAAPSRRRRRVALSERESLAPARDSRAALSSRRGRAPSSAAASFRSPRAVLGGRAEPPAADAALAAAAEQARALLRARLDERREGSGGTRAWLIRAAAYDDLRRARAAAEVDRIVEAAWVALRLRPDGLAPQQPPLLLHLEDEAALHRRIRSRAEFACRHRLFRLDVASPAGGFEAAVAARAKAVDAEGGAAPPSAPAAPAAPGDDDCGRRLAEVLAAALQWVGPGVRSLAYPHPEMHPLLPPQAAASDAATSLAPQAAAAAAPPRLSPAHLLHLVNVGLTQAVPPRPGARAPLRG